MSSSEPPLLANTTLTQFNYRTFRPSIKYNASVMKKVKFYGKLHKSKFAKIPPKLYFTSIFSYFSIFNIQP